MSKSESRNRTALLPSIRCFPEDKDAVMKKADAAGLSIGLSCFVVLSVVVSRPNVIQN
nr:MobB [Serratia proteamaculans]